MGKEFIGCSPRTAQVVQHFDLDAPFGRPLQRCQDPLAQFVRIEGIKFHVDVVLRLVKVRNHLLEEFFPINKNFNAVVKCHQGAIQTGRKADQLPGTG